MTPQRKGGKLKLRATPAREREAIDKAEHECEHEIGDELQDGVNRRRERRTHRRRGERASMFPHRTEYEDVARPPGQIEHEAHKNRRKQELSHKFCLVIFAVMSDKILQRAHDDALSELTTLESQLIAMTGNAASILDSNSPMRSPSI